jgi:hypothetical protein
MERLVLAKHLYAHLATAYSFLPIPYELGRPNHQDVSPEQLVALPLLVVPLVLIAPE